MIGISNGGDSARPPDTKCDMSHMSHASLSFPVRERDAALLEAAQAAAAVKELRLELREQCVHLPPLPVLVRLLLTRA